MPSAAGSLQVYATRSSAHTYTALTIFVPVSKAAQSRQSRLVHGTNPPSKHNTRAHVGNLPVLQGVGCLRGELLWPVLDEVGGGPTPQAGHPRHILTVLLRQRGHLGPVGCWVAGCLPLNQHHESSHVLVEEVTGTNHVDAGQLALINGLAALSCQQAAGELGGEADGWVEPRQVDLLHNGLVISQRGEEWTVGTHWQWGTLLGNTRAAASCSHKGHPAQVHPTADPTSTAAVRIQLV